MTALPWHPSQGPEPDGGPDDISVRWLEITRLLEPGRIADPADCCSGRPRYRACLSSTGVGPGRELILCGHHYRASRDGLAAAGARVFDAHGRPVPDATVRA
jgi:hypothetical protein